MFDRVIFKNSNSIKLGKTFQYIGIGLIVIGKIVKDSHTKTYDACNGSGINTISDLINHVESKCKKKG